MLLPCYYHALPCYRQPGGGQPQGPKGPGMYSGVSCRAALYKPYHTVGPSEALCAPRLPHRAATALGRVGCTNCVV